MNDIFSFMLKEIWLMLVNIFLYYAGGFLRYRGEQVSRRKCHGFTDWLIAADSRIRGVGLEPRIHGLGIAESGREVFTIS